MLKVIICVFFCFFFYFNNVSAASLGPDINVALVVNQFSAEIASESDFQAVVKSGKEVSSFGPKKIFASVKDGKLMLDGKIIIASEIELVAKELSKPIQINRKSYRGKILIKVNADKKTLIVCNILPIEQYLYGVIAKEIVPLWPEEAIKAQTVAARSFAISCIEKKKDTGFDIRANELGQVYGGIEAEHAATNKQIDATRGIVLTYAGKPIEAYYHSCSGGYTENSENVWGTYVPYLRAVPDFDQESPKYNWKKSFTAIELENLLKQAGYQIGKLKSIKLSQLKAPPVKENDRGVSGRVLRITFIGDAGEVVLDGGKVRTVLQLSSTLFDIAVASNIPEFIEVPVLDVYGNEIGKKKIPVKTTEPSKPAYLRGFEDLRLITGNENEKIIIKGKGWGHGLGLSQWGARGMAIAASKNSGDYYKTILAHYYTNTKIEKIY